MEDTKFYPLLTDILPLDSIPKNLGFLKEGVEYLTGGIHYADLHVEKSIHGDAAFYHVNLIFLKRLGFEVPGTGGMALVLNPDLSASSITSIPVSLGYQWDILRYAEGRSFTDVIADPSVYFSLFLDLANISEKELLREFVGVVIDDPDPILKFVNDYNTANAATAITLAADFNIEEKIDILVKHIENSDQDIFEIVLTQLLANFNSVDVALAKTKLLFQRLIGEITESDIERLLLPRVRASIDGIRLALEFPRSILQPLLADGTINPDEQVKSQLSFNVGSIAYSTETGFEFAQESNFDFSKSAILNSGLTLELHDMKLDLSRTSNIPEATADGRPEDFVGVYVNDGTISFPAIWKSAPGTTGVIKARNLLIGTGGFSGTLSLEAIDNLQPGKLLNFTFDNGFAISLDSFSMTLKQNAIKESEIKGTLTIPGFKTGTDDPAKISIDIAILQDGDFKITASVATGFVIKCGDVFDITLKSVSFDKVNGQFCLGVSGNIKFNSGLLSSIAPIEVEKLMIWSDGRFEIEGGTIPLPKNIVFPIGPVKLAISAISLGSHQQIKSDGSTRNFRYFGFDGAVDVNPGGISARGNGITYYYPEDLILADSYLEIKSISIDLVIPGSASKDSATVLISGFLSIGGTAADPEYEGGISFSLPKIKLAGGASMKYQPKTPAFIVDAFVELSTPIPLGPTSMGFYGFEGLFGLRYIATKGAAGLNPDSGSWFDYYKAKTLPVGKEGVTTSKFEGPSLTKNYDGAFSIGAGVSLATASDGGKTFSLKLFLLLSLPDLIYLEGKANVLGERVGLTGEDPPFFAMLAISSQSVETGFGVNYQIPKDGNKGQILDLQAELRAAFFFHNSSAWFINFGTIENPTRARILSLFDATSYLMLSASGISAGAGVTFGFEKSYAGGMVSASVGVYIKVGAHISFERPQGGGFAMLGGHVNASLLCFSFYIVIDTSLSVEAPKPFYIKGKVHLCVGVKILVKKINKCFDVEFKWEKDPNKDTTAVLPFAGLPPIPSLVDPPKMLPLKGTNMLSGETFNIAYLGNSANIDPYSPWFDKAVLPLDSWVDLEFLKGLVPSANVDAHIGRLSGQAPANHIDMVPPVPAEHQVMHDYSIQAVEIKAWNGSAWVDYHPFEAMSPPDALSALNADPSAYKDGFWQNTGSGFSKLRLLAETSLSYMQQGQPGWYIPEQFGITGATLFCRTKLRNKRCLNWLETEIGTEYSAGSWRQSDTFLFCVSGKPGRVINWNNPFGIPRSLMIENKATCQIVFNKPCVEVNIKLTTFATGAILKFFKRDSFGTGFGFTLVETRILTQIQLLAQIVYNNPLSPISRIEIDPITSDSAMIYDMQVQLDSLYRQLYESKVDEKQKAVLDTRIKTTETEIDRFKHSGCSPKGLNSELLHQAIPSLEKQVKECQNELIALELEQKKICTEARDSQTLFNQCFPSVPSVLSYEIIENHHNGDSHDFSFTVYDDLTDAILFHSAKRSKNLREAESDMYKMLTLALNPESFILVPGKNKKYSFHIVDASGHVEATNPSIFKTAKDRKTFVVQTQEKLRTALSNKMSTLTKREGGKLPCEESNDHINCWTKLSTSAIPDKLNCNAIISKILSAREVYCKEYNSLYRKLYFCNKTLLDAATLLCTQKTITLDEKHKEYKVLSDQLAAAQELIKVIGKDGEVSPPEESPCSTLVHEVCCLSLDDYAFNISVPEQTAIAQDYQATVDGIEKMLTPIFRPHTKYSVHIQVSDSVDGGVAVPNDFYFGFRTAGPVGYFHLDPSANYVDPLKKPDNYMLTSLKGYIDYRRSYPNCDGQLIGAKPLFYEDARILIFFTKRYVYHFFGQWPAYNGLPAITGGAMQIVIKDPAGMPVPDPSNPNVVISNDPQTVVNWATDEAPRVPEDIRTLRNLRNPQELNPDFVGGECWFTGGDLIKPASVYTQVVPNYLKPLKLYTAIVNNIYQGQTKEVHQYGFQTSRYPDFDSQVNSFKLDDGKGNRRKAIFTIDIALSSVDIDLMFDVVSGNMSSVTNAALAGTWADPFDRLIEAVMKIKPLDAAISTEFNIIRNSTTNAVVAMWLRNPEPFNDPKLPDDVLKRSLYVMNGLSPDLNYQVLFSKDRSQAFVMHPYRVLPVTQMQFRFAYIEWNGSEYIDHTLVYPDIISINN